ncbi:MAG: Xanthine phosphoribosyltransferase [candidate division WS2 bacterium]|uniref:Xanthine phosphoribosyltransferase n=1 Tax=Psychracetigena formicireducens TaxID=2986056 RepID=A0A9E2BL27_PSYF1|nr:Xanthine phosphoribosyltransferase [Candidatus Psychracetigena formicireducens]MBT9145014.1 Xanthine phosphoribosyltransferase [Candidatus Psychracetigena formicireducens]
MEEVIIVSWDEYFKIISDLIYKVLDSGFKPNQVICIARGGLIPGDIISRTLKLPLAVLSVSSYTPDIAGNTEKQGEVILSRDLTSANQINPLVLLVDDLTDSGNTLQKSVEWLNCNYQPYIKEIRTAILWHKEISSFTPNYHSVFISLNKEGKCPWILQPQDALAKEIIKFKLK